MNSIRLPVLLLSAAISSPALADQAPDPIQVRVEGLPLEVGSYTVERSDSRRPEGSRVILNLRHSAQFELLHGAEAIPTTQEPDPALKTARIELAFRGDESQEPFTLVDSKGRTLSGVIHLSRSWVRALPSAPSPRHPRLALGLSLAPNSFFERDVRDNQYSSLALRLEGDVVLGLTRNAATQFTLSGDMSAVVLEQLGDDDLRTLRLNSRVQQRVLGDSVDMPGLLVGLGAHHQSMVVASERFGFRNFTGPLVSASLDYPLKGGSRFQILGTLAMNGGFLQVPSLETREWSTRISYRTGTLKPGVQLGWPSEITYEFSSLAGYFRGVRMEGESHALGGRWHVF